MIEWIVAAAAASGLGGLALHRLLARRRRAEGALTVARLAEAAGATVELSGRIAAAPTRSPVSFHPCAAWWCWVESLDAAGRWQEVGASASGAFGLEDETGRIELEASQCRPASPPGAELVLRAGDWPPPGASGFHDALREVCGAAGLARPEERAAVRVRESLLPVGATVAARALVVMGPTGEVDGGYRGGTASAASLCPPPAGWIELQPR